MKKKFFWSLFSILTLIAFKANLVLAQSTNEATGVNDLANAGVNLGQTDIKQVIANIINIFLAFLGVIAVVLIIYAGWLWMTSRGDAVQISKAKAIIVSSVIGLVIILSAYSIASFVLKKLYEATGGSGTSEHTIIEPVEHISTACEEPLDASVKICKIKPDNTGAVVGQYITIEGWNFETYGPNSKVQFDGEGIVQDAGLVNCNGQVRWQAVNNSLPNYFRVKVVVPNVALGDYKIKIVTNSNNSDDYPDDLGTFEVRSGAIPPSIACIVPNSERRGNGVDIEGIGFGNTDGEVKILAWDGNTEQTYDFNDDWDNWTDNKITNAIIPNNALSGDVIVERDSLLSGPEYFQVYCTNGELDCASGCCAANSCVSANFCFSAAVQNNGPVISRISPDEGREGSIVSIYGSGFGANGGLVVFEGTESNEKYGLEPASLNEACTQYWSDNLIVVVVPDSIRDAGASVFVRHADGRESNSKNFDDTGPNTPSLCKVEPASGSFGTALTLHGLSFSASDQAVFGGVNSNVNFESVNKLETTVPNLAAGDINIWVKNNSGNSSNDLPFSVNASGGAQPIINSINPASGPESQYLTIIGSNFGNQTGLVKFVKNDGTAILGDFDFPDQCLNNFWQNDSIVVKVPDLPVASDYRVKVFRQGDNAESNFYNFAVTGGQAGPGLCFLEPNNGPANNLFDVTLYGDNFSNAGQVYFTSNSPLEADINYWNNQQLNVKVPEGALTGPVKVKVNSQDSNGLNFSVASCSNDSQCTAGQECCQEATGNYCAETCAADLACEYSWTITTASDPFALQEIYQCDNDNLQSPSPWPDGLNAAQSRDAYLDTNITGIFNADVDDADFNVNNIHLFACNVGGNFIDSGCQLVLGNLQIINHNSSEEGFVFNPLNNLDANRWYKVVLGDFHKADGNEIWSGATYDWHFRTQENLCQVASIAVTPATSPAADIYVAHQREFSASPQASNCNVCGGNYNWSTWTLEGANADKAEKTWERIQSTNIAKVKVKGLQATENITPATLEVRAGLNSSNSSAFPKIKDAILEVTDYGPNCNSSCSNALVWAEFNTSVLPSSLLANVKINQCNNETCSVLSAQNLVTDTILVDDGTRLNIFHNNFTANAWYKVSLLAGLKNVAGYNLGTDFSWNFQVNSEQACSPASLSLSPAYYLASSDETINYSAWPYSAANGCDPQGQALDPTDYIDYAWTLDPAQVANLQISDIYQTEVTPRNNGIATITSSLPAYALSDQATLEVDFGDASVYPEPKILQPTKPQTPACLNAAVEVQFNTTMDRNSVAAGLSLYKESATEQLPGFCVKKSGDWFCPVTTDFTLVNRNNQSKALLYPRELLTANKRYLALVSASVKSSQGVNLAESFLNFDRNSDFVNDAYIWVFSTNNQMCQVSFVTVDPSPDLFSCSRNNCSGDVNNGLDGNQHQYTAIAYDPSGVPLLMDEYQWFENNDLLEFVSDNQQAIEATATNKNGSTSLIARASDDMAGTASGSAQVDIFLCENPWPRVGEMASASFPYNFNNLYNFSTYYCQDSGRVNEPLLPYLKTDIIPRTFPAGDQNLTEFIFIVDPKEVVIAKTENQQPNIWWKNLLAKFTDKVLASIPAPTAPSTLTLADNTADGVKIQWMDQAITETGFNVYRKSSQADWYKIGTVDSSNINPVNFTDNSVIANQVYSYRVTAFNDAGESAASNEITVTAKASSLDVIGVRVMRNSEHLSLADWYQKYAPNPDVAGKTEIINGYPALRVANTVYINALNVHEDKVYSNIYILSYNLGARVSTEQIVDQMLENFKFSTNIANQGFCSADPSLSCSSNFDCPAQSNCDAQGDKLRRDNQRLGDLLGIKNKLTSYANNYKFCSNNGNISCTQNNQCPSGGTCVPYYPLLNSGTYVSGMSVSPWPSWREEFSSVLGTTLPVDPLNKFSFCPDGFDPATCWNADLNKFTCPAQSSIYFYKNEGGSNYSLDANFEFAYTSSGYNFEPALDSHIERNNPQCNNVSFIPEETGSLACGNGVVEAGEECDGGFRNLCDINLGNQSWWNEHLGGCYPKGSLDADGNSIECTWYEANPTLTAAMCGGYCGNGNIESPHEQCEGTNFGGLEYSCLDGGPVTCSFCSPSCVDGSVANLAFCGDGIINSGEECDGLNLADKSCQAFGFDIGNLSCNQCGFDTSDCAHIDIPTALNAEFGVSPCISEGNRSVNLSLNWTANNPGAYYQVQYKLDDGAFSPATPVQTNDNFYNWSWSFSEAPAGDSAQFRVRACLSAEICSDWVLSDITSYDC